MLLLFLLFLLVSTEANIIHTVSPDSPLSILPVNPLPANRIGDDLKHYRFKMNDFIAAIQVPNVKSILNKKIRLIFSQIQDGRMSSLQKAWKSTGSLDRLEKSIILAFAITSKQFTFAKHLINKNVDQSIMIRLLDRIPDLPAMQVYDHLGFLKDDMTTEALL